MIGDRQERQGEKTWRFCFPALALQVIENLAYGVLECKNERQVENALCDPPRG